MKKIFLLFILTLQVGCLVAQDTIVYGDSVYMYEDTVIPNCFCNEVADYRVNPWSEGYAVAKKYYSEREQLIYGIAIAISNYIHYDSTHVYNPVYADSMDNVVNQRRSPECFIASLYQKTGNGLTLVDTVRWHYPPVERIMEYTIPNQRPDCASYYPDTLTSYAHMFEFYFKEPHRVYDTFYVGKYEKAENYMWGDPKCTIVDNDSSISIDFYDWIIPDENGANKWIYFPDWANPNDYVEGYRTSAINMLTVMGNYNGIFSYIHPILQPRYDICRAPGKPWMTARTGTSATFEWGEVEDSAMLVVGDYLGDPDTMAAIALGPGSTGHTVAGLEPGTYYGAWLRQRCRWQMQDGDSTRWSDWSERVIFSTDLDGIAAAEPVPMSVYPNPARGSFTVETEDLPARLTLYNAQGTEIYAVNLRTQRTTIGISDLPKGVYFAVLTTPTGSATRRLVNEGAF